MEPGMMNLREVYTESVAQEFDTLALLIEFLVFKKEVLTFESDANELERYYSPKNSKRVHQLLLDYKKELGGTA